MLDLDAIPTQAAFGSVVGISQQAVSSLVERGVFSAGMPFGEMLLAYCSHLREQAAGRAAAGDLDLAAERAALARVQRERIELQNAVTRGELAPVVAIEEVLAKAGSRVGAILDGIPGMVRRRVPTLSATDVDAIAETVAKARNAVAGLRLADLDDAEDEEAQPAESEVDA